MCRRGESRDGSAGWEMVLAEVMGMLEVRGEGRHGEAGGEAGFQ